MTNAPGLPSAPVVCACGLVHLSWTALDYVGIQDDGDGGRLELRNCPCGSTISVELPRLRDVGLSMSYGVYHLADARGCS